MKKIICMILTLIILTFSASAMEGNDISQQLEDSGANELINELPESSRDYIYDVYDDFSFENIGSIEFEDLIKVLVRTTNNNLKSPLNALIFIIGLIILCSLLENMKDPLRKGSMSDISSFLITLAVASVLIIPIRDFIGAAGQTIENSCRFQLAYAPVYAGLAVSSGQPLSAAAYSGTTMVMTELISIILSSFALPVLGILLGVSLIASVSGDLRLDSLSQGLDKSVKWILGILATVFVGVLTVKSVIAGAGDSVSVRSVKFMVSGFVPVAGSALGESLTSVFAGMRYLKGTVGAFGLIAFGFIFIPAIIQNILWIACVNIGSYASEVFGLPNISRILKSCGSVLNILLSFLIFTLVLMIISTAVLLMTGGGAVG